MSNNNIVNENIRYLLWDHKIPSSKWVEQLAAWAECGKDRAEEILDGADVSDQEQSKIVRNHPDVTLEVFQYQRLVADRQNILQLNLAYLFENSEVKQVDLAKQIGTTPVTVSRWKAGIQKPHPNQLRALCHQFHLSPTTNLERDALFLSRFPVGLQKKKWLIEQIEKLSIEDLDSYFPSLYRILKEP
jgi:transcriptional regulator with XRE-family HTH domain